MEPPLSKTLTGVLAITGLSAALAALTPATAQAATPMFAAATSLAGVVRNSTRRYLNVNRASAEGYGPLLGCTSSDEEGAMGLHYANAGLVGDGALDPTRPEVLVYEPTGDGHLRLVAVEYVVIAEAWNAGHAAPPVLMGQLLNYEESPNRYGLPAFYALHVWAWKANPKGMFVDWNPRVSCEEYTE